MKNCFRSGWITFLAVVAVAFSLSQNSSAQNGDLADEETAETDGNGEEKGKEKKKAEAVVRYFADDQTPIGSAAVRVKRGFLVHSASVSPRRRSGEVTKDFASALDELVKYEPTRGYTGGELKRTMVKLHVCLAPGTGSAKDLAAVVKELWPQGNAPAITVVGSSGGANMSVDAVWHVGPENPEAATEGWASAFEDRYPPSAGVLSPRKDIIHVSGRAASGELAEATEGTMVQLFDVLQGLGAEREDVVQVKAFIKPIAGRDEVEQVIADSFEDSEIPPIVFVEWTSSSRATEIELIASARERTDVGDSMSYYTPPTDKPSPVYSRVGRIHGDEVVFIGGLTGSRASSGEQEVKTLYDGLQRISAASGTDLRHFAKATYYVSGNDSSQALNALRPYYYDPKRPPAASKVAVDGVAVGGRTILIDMVAAPVGVKEAEKKAE